jgi:hypothetical protein
VFQLAIVDVDTGVVISTATSLAARAGRRRWRGAVECRFPGLPLRARQYALRLSILDQFQLASYDVITAGPRFAVTGQGIGVDSLADEQDGLVSLPFEFGYRAGMPAIGERG